MATAEVHNSCMCGIGKESLVYCSGMKFRKEDAGKLASVVRQSYSNRTFSAVYDEMCLWKEK